MHQKLGVRKGFWSAGLSGHRLWRRWLVFRVQLFEIRGAFTENVYYEETMNRFPNLLCTLTYLCLKKVMHGNQQLA